MNISSSLRHPLFFTTRSARRLIVAGLALAGLSARAADVVYPSGAFNQTVTTSRAGIVDITQPPYSADKTGTTDVTPKITQAISDLLANHPAKPAQRMTIYFPSGTYAVSNTLDWVYVNGGTTTNQTRLVFQGQNRDTTVIKLADNATGFTNASVQKPVIKTESLNGGTGSGNNAYDNSILDLTVDLGSGNAGAVGIDYHNSNTGSIRNVLIRASGTNPVGYAGITMARAWPGPGLLKGVEVQGLNYGIVMGHNQYGMWLEDIKLSGQAVAGIQNNGNVLGIRKLTSTNTKPAIKQSGSDCLMVLVDSTLSGGAATANAIENGGSLVVRNTTTSGYALAVNNTVGSGTDAPNGLVKNFVSHNVFKGFSTSADVTLNLPISETPVYTDNNFANWANVMDYGAAPNSSADQTSYIQAALNSGKTTVYFPPGQYPVEGQLTVSGSVRRILGLGSVIRPRSGVYQNASNPKPVFTVNTSASLVIDNLYLWSWFGTTSGGASGILQSGTQTLSLTNFHCDLHHAYDNSAGSGPLYLENASGGAWYFNNPGQSVWARHLNPENAGTKIVNNGCNLWILGLKTEHIGTAIETKGGGQTEVLGGFLLQIANYAGAPAFTSTNSRVSYSYVTQASTVAADYGDLVKETQGSTTATLARALAYRHGSNGSAVPLYTGFPAEIIIDNTDPQATLNPSNGWVPSTSTAGYYGSNYFTNQGVGAGTKSVRYTPDIPTPGYYQVFMRWTAGSNRPPVVPVKITSLVSPTTVNVNEQTNNGVWVSLGTFPFDAGTGGYVDLLTNGTSGYYVIADAVKFVFVSP